MWRTRFFFLAAAWAVLALGTGCASMTETKPGKVLAAIQITGSQTRDITRAARVEFEAAGYTTAMEETSRLGFEKPAGTWNTVVYGGWSGSVWLRVRCEVSPLAAGGHQLNCRASYVANHGDPRFEEERSLTGLKAGPYKKLLRKIKDRVETPPRPNREAVLIEP